MKNRKTMPINNKEKLNVFLFFFKENLPDELYPFFMGLIFFFWSKIAV